MLTSVLELILLNTLRHPKTTRQLRPELFLFFAEKILNEQQMRLKNHSQPLSLSKVIQVTVTVFPHDDVWKMEDADSDVKMSELVTAYFWRNH